MSRIIVFCVILVLLFSCIKPKEIKPNLSQFNIDFKLDEWGCGEKFGLLKVSDSVYLYQITDRNIRFKSINDQSIEKVIEVPECYKSFDSKYKLYDIYPISTSKLLVTCIEGYDFDFQFSLFDCKNQKIDTVYTFGLSDSVVFVGGSQGNIHCIYNEQSNSLFLEAVDYKICDEKRMILDSHFVCHIDLDTRDYKFLDMKYPKNYRGKCDGLMSETCLFQEYEGDVLISFPVDEAVYRYDPLEKQVNDFTFGYFEHDPFLEGYFMDNTQELNKEKFIYSRVFQDDSTNYFYRFYYEKAKTIKEMKPVGVAVFDENKEFIQTFSLSNTNLKNTINFSVMTDKGLLFIEDVDRDNDIVTLQYLRIS